MVPLPIVGCRFREERNSGATDIDRDALAALQAAARLVPTVEPEDQV